MASETLCPHEWEAGDRWGVIVGVSRCKRCGALSRSEDFPPSDPREPDYSRPGIFTTHNCWKCQDGQRVCVTLDPRGCEYPHARND